MEKKIQEYLHLYIGCKALLLNYDGDKPKSFTLTAYNYNYYRDWWADIRPLLRPLSSMTEEEMLEYARIERPETTQVKLMGDKVWSFYDPNDGSFYKWSTHSLKHPISEQTRYLLSRGFDLFGLIEAGLAIDKTLHPSTIS